MDDQSVSENEKLCRLCLDFCTVYSSLFENNATEMLDKLTSIKIETEDPFTTALCSECFTDLKNAFTIQQKIIKNQKKLAKLVNVSNVAVKETKSNVYENSAVSTNTCYEEAVNSSETTENEVIKMEVVEVDTTAEIFEDYQYYESENSNLIADTSYGHVEEENDSGPLEMSAIPGKSKEQYKNAYSRFDQWCCEKKITTINEKVLLAFFKEKSSVQKPSSLWCNYTMLKATLSTNKNIDISKFTNLISFLKSMSIGYKAKKSKVLTKEHFMRFLEEADDAKFLMVKVALIIGVAGACRREELAYLKTEYLKDEGNYIRFHLPDRETKIRREFIVSSGNFQTLNLVDIIRKYLRLRPNNVDHKRLFLSYRNGKCTRQPVGYHTFGSMPKIIAQFLGLPNADHYNGHCFRKSSALILASAGATMLSF